ncbi:MAG: DUF2785 domain-containing protein [Lysobacteraceae bacterium]
MPHPATAIRKAAIPFTFLLGCLVPAAALCACPASLRSDVAAAASADADTAGRQRLALRLLDCLDDPDPTLRDGLAYTTLAQWMRAGELEAKTLLVLRGKLQEGLRSDDADGFRAPFSALVLSEVVRVDRVTPYLDESQRQQTLKAAADYLREVRDYRGFADGEGWRHGVAHGADVLLQLALNPALDKESAPTILDAVAAQVAPSSVAYHFGEEGRLARVLVAVASRGWLDEAGWQTWFTRLADPAPLTSWNDAFGSEAALNRLHNLRAFLLAMHVRVAGSDSDAAKALMTGLRPAIEAVP